MAAQQEPFDVNFFYPVHELENDRVKLTPYIPRLHSKAFFEGIEPHPDIFDFFPFSPFESLEAFDEWFETRLRQDPSSILFAVIDKTKPAQDEQSKADGGPLAGIAGLFTTVAEDLWTELGPVITLPPFQRTHVTSTACTLLLKWAFEELRLRRVQWRADERNFASVRAAAKLGFKKELVARWARAVRKGPGKVYGYNIYRSRENDPLGEEVAVTHPFILSICWDDWEGEWAERAQERLGVHS